MRLLCTIIVGLFLSLSMGNGQTTHYVTTNADSGAGSLRDIVAGASSGDIIEFSIPASSTITLTSGDINCSNKGLTITGKIANGDTLTISGNNNSRIFFFWNANDDIHLEALKFINGYADTYAVGLAKGGAVYAKNSGKIKISHCRFFDNEVYMELSSFSDQAQGGAIYVETDTFLINYCSVSRNKVKSDQGKAEGGGIYINADNVTTEYNTIYKNYLDGYEWSDGCGLYISKPKALIISTNTIVGNKYSGNSNQESLGGGIFISPETLCDPFEIKNNTIVNNINETGAGIFSFHLATPTITGNIFLNNTTIFDRHKSVGGFFNSGGYNIFSDNPSRANGPEDRKNVTTRQLNLGSLQDNGGSTFTMLPGAGSFAVNSGNPNDISDAQNGPILELRDIGAAESPHITRYVKNTNDAGPESLRAVVAQAQSGDRIRFDIPASSIIKLTSGEIDCGSKSLRILGKIEGNDTLTISGDNNSRIFYFENSDHDIYIEKLKFINGLANASAKSGQKGGAIYSQSGNVTFTMSHCRIINCKANAAFSGGSNFAQGGGLNVRNAGFILEHCVITGNEVITNKSGAEGGGVFAVCDDIIITNNIISDNTASNSNDKVKGGGLYTRASKSILVEENTIANNSSTSETYTEGGGLYVEITDSDGAASIVKNTINDNETIADDIVYGVGIYAESDGELIVSTNTIVYNNTTTNNSKGGGIFTDASSTTEIKNNTIVENISNDGGGMYITARTNPTVTSNIIALNEDLGGNIDDMHGNFTSGGYNIFSNSPSDANSLGDQINIAATQLNLGPLQDNGGNTLTRLPLAGSVAQGTGNPFDTDDAQNGPINGKRDVGSCESLKSTYRFVINSNDAGPGSLRDVISNANSGDTIQFDIPASSVITLTSGEIDCGARGLFIQGKIDGNDTLTISGNNNSRIFYFDDVGENIKIQKLKLINGLADGPAIGGQKGGAVWSTGSGSFTMSHCRIMNCKVNAAFSGGSNFAQGGGLNVRNERFILEHCVITGNEIITNKSGAEGGGVFAVGDNITIRNNIISDNTTSNSDDKVKGGGLYTRASESILIEENTIANNTSASETFTEGGGLYVEITEGNGSATIIRNTINDNEVIADNQVYGVGIYAESNGELTVSTNTIVYNSTTTNNSQGGGIYTNASSTTEIKNNTIVENTSNDGGGMYITAGTDPTVTSNIIALNEDLGGNIDDMHGSFTSGSYNIFSNSPSDANNLGDQINIAAAQLNLGPLKDNGSIRFTRVPMLNSVAFDSGNPMDVSDAQNSPINNVRESGAAESSEIPATMTRFVTNNTDNKMGSLRDIVNKSYSGDTIQFSIPVSSIITLTSGEINCESKGLIIEGKIEGSDTLTISGNESSRIFYFNDITEVTKIEKLKLIDGMATRGGAIRYEGSGSFTLSQCRLKDNKSQTLNGKGGGLYLDGKTITLNHCVIADNEIMPSSTYATLEGGGAFISGSHLTLRECIITDNKINVPNGSPKCKGGGIFARASDTLIIYNNTISRNSIAAPNASLIEGVGLYTEIRYDSGPHSYAMIRTNTITSNGSTASSSTGAGIFAESPYTTYIRNNTIIDNYANEGGSIYINSTNNSDLAGNIIAQNYSPTNSTLNEIHGPWTSRGYNIFSDNPSGAIPTDLTGINSIDLKLGPLQDNGGSTLTMVPEAGSIAIGYGNPFDMSDAQNGPIVGIRDVGAAESPHLEPMIYQANLLNFVRLQDAIDALSGSVGNIQLMKNHTERSFSGTLPSNATLTIPTGLQLTIKDPDGLKDNNSTKKKE